MPTMCGRNQHPTRCVNAETALKAIRKSGQDGQPRLCATCTAAFRKKLRRAAKPPRPKRKWTSKEIDYVRVNYRHDRESAARIAAALGRTPNAVKGKVQAMGIAKPGSRKAWDRDQDARLWNLAGTKSPARIAHIMGRSANSVVVRMKRLGIHRRNRDEWYTLSDVAAILGVDHHWVRDRVHCGALTATRHHVVSHPTEGSPNNETPTGATWHVTARDLKMFVRKHADELTGRNVDLMQLIEILDTPLSEK